MKKIVFLSVFLFVASLGNAQDFDKISKTQLKTLEDYKKAEPEVLKAADFLFRTPSKPETQNRAIAFQFILLWMEGTDAYTFSIGEPAMTVTKGNQDLLGMYFAGLTKTALESPNKKLSDNELHDKTTELLAKYCAEKSNKLKPNRALKKVIKKLNR